MSKEDMFLCECGCDWWTIHDGAIQCVGCKKMYRVAIPTVESLGRNRFEIFPLEDTKK